ncbi:MAG TPA: hypothetical protein VH475_18935 [Tepidisphaeraceae bacterium]|jgi:plasmid stability protein
MAQLIIDLPDDVQSALRARAAESGHGTLEQYVQALLSEQVKPGAADVLHDLGAPEHLTARSEGELEAKVLEGLGSPASEMTDADWDEMRRRFLQRHSNGRPR